MSRGTVSPRCRSRGQVIAIASRQAPIAASPTSRRFISRGDIEPGILAIRDAVVRSHPYAAPMVIALIAVGVIAFLAIDAYIILRVFRSRASRDDYGTFMVPGEGTVTVPAGKLKLSYQEEYKAKSDEDTIYFGVPDQLQVSVINDT